MPREELGYSIPPPEAEGPNFLARLVKLNRYLLLLLIIPTGVIYFWPPFKDQEIAEHKLASLSQKRDTLKTEVKHLEQKLDQIKNDPEYLETMARDRLHLQKDGEVILRFED
ncbi:hypothetical protein BH11VER1_BH11VER1_18980 [soil metagenome]